MSAWFPWFEKLRDSSGPENASVILAQGIGEIAKAVRTGVFLLDHTRQNLLYFASWASHEGAKAEGKQSVSLRNFDDPLCLALHQGSPFTIALEAGMEACRSQSLLQSGARAKTSRMTACPLLAWDTTTIGGIVLNHETEAPLTETVQALCAYGALLLAAFEQKKNTEAQVHSLDEDIRRLELPSASKKTVAVTTLLGQSAAMQKIRERIVRVAPHPVSVLLTGETGTGKELAASAIHAASPRRVAPFVKINCGALPSGLLESELFGHKKGAFSSAYADHTGLLRSADGVTVLLDEIGEMPLELQPKLLRFLQDQNVRPVGDTRSYPVDVRIISATNIDIQEALRQGRLRKDLYYRLATYHIHMPSLAERPEDIPELARYFLEQHAKNYNLYNLSISDSDMFLLCSSRFEGNVRELSAILESGVLSADGDFIRLDNSEGEVPLKPGTFQQSLAAYEKRLIHAAIASCNGNVTKAAKALGIPRTTLDAKLRKAR